MTPTFSIVIPAYNAEKWAGEAIDSVFGQTVHDWELIFVDDGSTDRTAAIAKGYTDARVHIVSQPNSGQSSAQNRGISLSNGEFVLLLDADDRLRPYALSHLHSALTHYPDCSVAYGSGTYIREDGTSFRDDPRVKLSRKPSGHVLRHMLKGNLVSYVGAALIRLEAIRRVGGLRTDLTMAQDWELWCRLASVGTFAYAGPKVVLEYRMHEKSIARSCGAAAESQRAAIEAVFNNPDIHRLIPVWELRRLG